MTKERKYITLLEQDMTFVLNRFREAVDESDPAKRLELYEAAVEVCDHPRRMKL
jgi:hypothetical protein